MSTTASTHDTECITHFAEQLLEQEGKLPPVALTQQVAEALDIDHDTVDEVLDAHGQKGADGSYVTVTTVGDRPDIVPGSAPDTESNGKVTADDDDGASDQTRESDFTVLDNVTKVEAEVLKDAGFTTFADLAHADVDAIMDTDVFPETVAEELKAEATSHVDGGAMIANMVLETRFESTDVAADGGTDTASGGSQSGSVSHLASNIDQPAGPPTALGKDTVDNTDHLNGLPVLEEHDHPLVDSVAEYTPIYERQTATGETIIKKTAKILGQNNYSPLLIGHAGTGKDTILKYIAARTNRPEMTINMDSSMISQELLGIHQIDEDGSITWEDGPIPRAVRNGWMLIIDEINAAPPGVFLALQQLLESNGELHLKGRNEVIVPHESFRIAATMNPPEQGYSGTEEMNVAALDRFHPIHVEYLPSNKETDMVYEKVNGDDKIITREEARNLVNLARKFRERSQLKNDVPRITPRTLIRVGKASIGSIDVRKEAESTIKGMCKTSVRYKEEAAIEVIRDIFNGN